MDIAQAYVQILPSTDGIQQNLTAALSDAGSSAAQTAGSKIGSVLSSAVGVGTAALGAITSGVTAAGSAFISSAGDVASYGDNIDKMAQKMGMSAEAYQEWDAVMQHSGTSMETMKASMKTLANAVESGNDAFERIGLTQEELAHMSQQDIFEATIAGLQNVNDETERTYLAGQLLGRGATELGALLNTSAADTQAMRDRVHELGGVMSDEAVKASAAYQDSLQDMTTAIDGVKRNLIAEFLPGVTSVMDGVANLFSGDSEKGLGQVKEGINQFAETLSETIPQIFEFGTSIITAIVEAITENLPLLVDTALQTITTFATGISESIPQMVPQIVEIVTQIVTTLTDPNTLNALLTAALAIITGLATGIIQSLPTLIAALPEIITNLVTFLVGAGPQIAEAGFTLLINLVANLPGIIAEVLKAIPRIVTGLANAIVSGYTSIVRAGYDLLTHLSDKFGEVGRNLSQKVKSIPRDIVEGIKGTIQWFKDIGKSLISGLWSGFVEKWNELKSTVQSWGDNVVGFFKSVFSINSPSKRFMEIGASLDEGLALGVEQSGHLATDALSELGDSMTATVGRISSMNVSPVFAPQAQAFEVPRQVSGRSNQQTAYLVLDKEVLGRVVYNLYNTKSARVGVNLAGGVV